MFRRGVVLLSFNAALIETLLLIPPRCVSSGPPQFHQLGGNYSLKMIVPVSWNKEEMKTVRRSVFTKFHLHNTFHYTLISNIQNHCNVHRSTMLLPLFSCDNTWILLFLLSFLERMLLRHTQTIIFIWPKQETSVYMKECFGKCPPHLTSPHLTSQDFVVLMLCCVHALSFSLSLSLSLSRWWKTVLRRIQSLLLRWCADGWRIEGALPHNRHSQHRVSLCSDLCVCRGMKSHLGSNKHVRRKSPWRVFNQSRVDVFFFDKKSFGSHSIKKMIWLIKESGPYLVKYPKEFGSMLLRLFLFIHELSAADRDVKRLSGQRACVLSLRRTPETRVKLI